MFSRIPFSLTGVSVYYFHDYTSDCVLLHSDIERCKTDRKLILRYDMPSFVRSDRVMKPKHTPTAHDAAFKGFMTQIDSAKDFFDIHLPEHIKSLCDFSTLALTNSSFITSQFDYNT